MPIDRSLERKIANAKDEVEGVINILTDIISNQDQEITELEDEIEELKQVISNLEDELHEFKTNS